MSNISINELFEEQRHSNQLAILCEIPDDKERLRLIPWMPGMHSACTGGLVIPRSAIQQIKKTGKTLRCCGKTLQIVEVVIAEGHHISFADLFKVLSETHRGTMISRGTGNQPVARGYFRPPYHHELPPWFPGGGGGFAGGQDDGSFNVFDCLHNCNDIAAAAAADAPPAQRAMARALAYADCVLGCHGI